MKKLTILLTAVLFSATAAFSQPVSDQGVIPIGVTLNSILRLNITSGGNIEYVVNTIDQYTNGIVPQTRYETHFTVASSVDFDVSLIADAANFTGVDDATHTIPLDNLGYTILGDGVPATGSTLLAGVQQLSNVSANIILSDNVAPASGNAGDITQNAFVLQWELGTVAVAAAGGSLLNQSITSDRYVVNVLLELSQH